jgi:acyl carrier protein
VTDDLKEPDVADTADPSGSRLTRGDVLDIVRNQLAEILEIDASSINESSSFSDDLNADSLALIELVEALEEELADQMEGFRIDDEDLEDLRTVRDAVDYVTAKLEPA